MQLLRSAGSACLLSLALSPVPSSAQQAPDPMADRLAACIACHGKQGRATADGYFPRIAGKPAGYLFNQLINFREGRRQSPMMRYMVTPLSHAYLQDIADYFAAQHPPYPPPQATQLPAATLARAARLVLHGDPARKVPACIACHGQPLTGLQPAIPGLLGLPRDYINAQFGAWKLGTRRAAAPDCMAHIARQLTTDEIGALSAWLAARPIPADMSPAPAASLGLPMACGSAPQ